MRVDAAAYLGPWPFRNIEGTVRGLAATMKELALDQALVSPMPALFYTDTEPANDELLRRLKGRPNLWAAPVVNLRMADAKRHIEQLARHPQVRAVRFAPGFHGYPVSQINTVFDSLAGHNLAAVIQLRMQDERSHPPTTFVPPAPIEEVISLAESAPAARIAAAAARQGEVENSSHAERIRALPNLWLDTTHLDGVGCIRRACEAVGAEKLLFGTLWPFFYARSALLKAEEAQLPPAEMNLLMGGNAAKVFGLEGMR